LKIKFTFSFQGLPIEVVNILRPKVNNIYVDINSLSSNKMYRIIQSKTSFIIQNIN
jgi:hypothetical protein